MRKIIAYDYSMRIRVILINIKKFSFNKWVILFLLLLSQNSFAQLDPQSELNKREILWNRTISALGVADHPFWGAGDRLYNVSTNDFDSEQILRNWVHAEFLSMALGVIKAHPPEKNHYVLLGGSPSIVGVYLEVLIGSESLSHLPLNSDFYGDLEGKLKIDGETYITDYTEDTGQEVKDLVISGEYKVLLDEQKNIYDSLLKKHFQQFLPAEKVAGKKIVVIDMVGSGNGLSSAIRQLNKHYPQETKGFAMYNTTSAKGRRYRRNFAQAHGFSMMKISIYLAGFFAAEKSDEFRVFEKFNPSVHANFLIGAYTPPRKPPVDRFKELYTEAQKNFSSGMLNNVGPKKTFNVQSGTIVPEPVLPTAPNTNQIMSCKRILN